MKLPSFEQNCSVSKFIPTNEAMNDALQNTQVDNQRYNGVTLQDMRDNATIYQNRITDPLDVRSMVQSELQAQMPEVKKVAQRFKQAKETATKQTNKHW